MSDRIDRLRRVMQRKGVDALLVTGPVNVRWLSGFTGTSGLCVVDGDAVRFVTDFRYREQAAEQLGSGWSIDVAVDLLEAAVEPLEGPLRLGFDENHLTFKAHSELRSELPDNEIALVEAGGLVEGLREVKEEGEVAAIRAAAQLADAALQEVLSRGLTGRTEREVATDIEFTMRRMGAHGPSFPPIVAHGPHGALPHAEPRDVEIAAGTLCVVDWGAELDGYASDCTRTFATGELSDEDAGIYELVLGAQLHALDQVEPGIEAKVVDAAARDIIAAGGHGNEFGHGLGHGVGAEVHEAPRLSQRSDAILRPGHVVTIEPGIYVPGRVGVRIEDLVVVTSDGHEVLSGLPKELTTA